MKNPKEFLKKMTEVSLEHGVVFGMSLFEIKNYNPEYGDGLYWDHNKKEYFLMTPNGEVRI